MGKRPRVTRRLADSWFAAVLVSPTVLVLLLVIAYPVVAAMIQSTYGAAGLDEETGFVSDSEPFVGLANYTAIFGDGGARFWNEFVNTSFLATEGRGMPDGGSVPAQADALRDWERILLRVADAARLRDGDEGRARPAQDPGRPSDRCYIR